MEWVVFLGIVFLGPFMIGFFSYNSLSFLVTDKMYLLKKYFTFGLLLPTLTLSCVIFYMVLVSWIGNPTDVELSNSVDALAQSLFQDQTDADAFKETIYNLRVLEVVHQRYAIGIGVAFLWMLAVLPIAFSIAQLKDSIYIRNAIPVISGNVEGNFRKLEVLENSILDEISFVNRTVEGNRRGFSFIRRDLVILNDKIDGLLDSFESSPEPPNSDEPSSESPKLDV